MFAILASVVSAAAEDATVEAWQAGCAVLGAVAAAGVADVGAAALRQLLAVRPNGARPPAALGTGFARIMRDAGLAA